MVVAAFQAEQFLEMTLRSLQAQSYTKWECVVVDDGSQDGTWEVGRRLAEEDPRIRCIAQKKNGGVSSARNEGLRILSPHAELVSFLDSDDLLLRDGISTLVESLDSRPDAQGACGWSERIDASGEIVQVGRQRAIQTWRPVGRGFRVRTLGPTEDTSFETLAHHGSLYPPATALVRRTVLQEVGGFDSDLKCQEDGDIWLRVARRGPFVFVDRQVAWYRKHDRSAMLSTAVCVKSLNIVRRKAWLAKENTLRQRWILWLSFFRVRTWAFARNLRRCRQAASSTEPLSFAWAGCRLIAVSVEILVARPMVPPLWLVQMALRLDAQCGFTNAD